MLHRGLSLFFFAGLVPLLLGGACSAGSSGNDGASGSGGSLPPGGSGGSSAGTAPGGTTAGGASGAGSSAGGSGGTAAGAAGTPQGGGAGTAAGSGGSAGGSSGASGAGGKGGGMILVRDNFDAGTTFDTAKWAAPSGTGAPVIDSMKAHSAPNSLRAQGTSAPDGFLIPAMGILPAPAGRFYVRVWVNFEKPTSAITGHIGFLVGADSRDNSGTEMRLGVSTPPGFGMGMLDVNLQNPKDNGGGEVTRFSNGFTTGGDPLNEPGFSFMADRWYCVEALFSSTPSEFRTWIDDMEVQKLHVTDFKARETGTPRTMWAPTFSFLKIGVQNYGGDAGRIWYDDVVVGTEAIGCN